MKNKFLIGLTIVILLIILRFCFPSKYTSNDELNDLQKLVNDEKVIKNIPTNKCVGMDYQSTSFYFKNLCERVGLETHHIINPCIQAKAVKNEVELKGARQANIRDGVSIAKFLFWLKNSDNINKISEIDAANYLYQAKLMQKEKNDS